MNSCQVVENVEKLEREVICELPLVSELRLKYFLT